MTDPAQIERVVWHGAAPGNSANRRSVVIETKGALPAIKRSFAVVSWIDGTNLPEFDRMNVLGTAMIGWSAENLGACMALKCTANNPPPAELPESAFAAFKDSKQYRGLQTFEITHYPSSSRGATVIAKQRVGYTAPSTCGPIPPDTFTQGEASPLNHVDIAAGKDTKIEALMKFRVSTPEESAAVDKATSFPNSLILSRSRIRHVPWVWNQTTLRVDAKTGRISWQLTPSAFPTNTIYMDGKKVKEIPQQRCSVVLESRFRKFDSPRQTLEEEKQQADKPLSQQEETVKSGLSASGKG